MISIFDIETDGLLNELTTVFSLVIKNESGMHSFTGFDIEEGLAVLKMSDTIVGHNILGFDLPALKKVYGFNYVGKVVDTLVYSRLVFPNIMLKEPKWMPGNLKGHHSLEAWGRRLKMPKGDHKDFSKWTPEMQRYCEQDVLVTSAVYDRLNQEKYSEQAIQLEHDFQRIIYEQENNGVLFKTEAAKDLSVSVAEEIERIATGIKQQIPYHLKQGRVFTPKTSNKKLGYRPGCSFSKISFDGFNPGSRTQLISFLKRKYNWEPTTLTDKGNPKLDDQILRELPYPEAERFADYYERIKVHGYLSEGDNAWLKLVKNNRIYGRVITNGAVTGRCTHFQPNLAQVPSMGAFMGKECRSLFHAGGGFMVGADASGLELRMLAHYLAPYDDGEYARQILQEDIHEANRRAAGLETRDQAKRFIYAFLYGAGSAKLGSVVTDSKDVARNRAIGQEMKSSFIAKIKGMGDLIADVHRSQASKGYLKGLDGRRIEVDSEHKCLNYLLQCAGAVIMKQSNVIFWQNEINKYRCKQVLNIHDEVQFTTDTEDYSHVVGKTFVDSITKSGEHFHLRIKLDGEYKVGRNWAETH